jgi:hypothetical protein
LEELYANNTWKVDGVDPFKALAADTTISFIIIGPNYSSNEPVGIVILGFWKLSDVHNGRASGPFHYVLYKPDGFVLKKFTVPNLLYCSNNFTVVTQCGNG